LPGQAARSASSCCSPISGPSRSSRADATTQPNPVEQIADRQPTGSGIGAGAPSSTGLIAVPRLAPSTSAKAACGGTAPWAASDMVSNTMATDECTAQVCTAGTMTSTTGSVANRAQHQA